MQIYDLSKELFSAEVYPGDPAPLSTPVLRLERGDPCNLTALSLGLHNGTHLDAPFHHCAGGFGVETIDLNKCVGKCRVVALSGVVTPQEIADILADGTQRLLLKGDVTLTLQGAEALCAYELVFLGVEALSVGDSLVHRTLLSHEIVILEAAVLAPVPEGEYFLVSPPLKMAGMDGSPARPLLFSLFG